MVSGASAAEVSPCVSIWAQAVDKNLVDPGARNMADSPPNAATVESFARDLHQLVHSVRLYPIGHPAVVLAAEHLIGDLSACIGRALTIGVGKTELEISGAFYGKAGSRASQLAQLLHERRILRLEWSRDAETSHILRFASLLAADSSSGTEIDRQLRWSGIHTIRVEPLDLARIHDAFREGPAPDRAQTPEEQRREAWLFLQRPDVDLEALASALESSQLWADLIAAAGLGQEAHGLVASLAAVLDRIEAAVTLLPEDRREAVFKRLSELGSHLTTADLATLVGRVPDDQRHWGPGTVAILRDITPDRFMDLLAHLASASGHITRRLAEVYRRFAPAGGTTDALERIQKRLASGDSAGFAQNVWQTVEDLLLRLEEDPFMVPEYAASLDGLTARSRESGGETDVIDLSAPAETHLDQVYLGLAAEGGAEWRHRLLARVCERSGQLQPLDAVEYVKQVDLSLPGLVDEAPQIARRIASQLLDRARDASAPEVHELREFCRAHESVLLDPLLQMLVEEPRMWSRRLIVDLLSSFSPASTRAIAAFARGKPWFVARNIATVLGRSGDPRGVLALERMADHDHPKVRREALRALAGLETPSACRILEQVASSSRHGRADRELAAQLLKSAPQKRERW
jgi:hypothetical protein